MKTNVSKNVPFLKSVALTLMSLVCFAGVSVGQEGQYTIEIYQCEGISRGLEYTEGEDYIEIKLSGHNESWATKTPLVMSIKKNGSNISYTIDINELSITKSDGDYQGHGVCYYNTGDIPAGTYYIVIKNDKISFLKNKPIFGPSFSSPTILSSVYCGGSATIDIDYEIENATGSEVIKLYKGTDFVSYMSTKSIDVTSQGEYHFELWYDGKCVDKSETIKVEAKAPMLDAIASKTNILRNVNEVIDPTIQVTPNLQTCDVDKTINVSLSDNTNYVYDAGTKKLTFKGTEPGTYPLTMTFTHGSLTKEVTISSSVVEYPACYNLLKEDDTPIEVCTDANGDLIIDLDASPFKDFKGTLTIPSDLEIVCNDFKIYGGRDNYEFKLINNGLIHCESDCSIGIEVKTLGSSTIDGNAIFVNGSTGSIIANNIDVRYRYAMPNFEGNWISTKNINILNGQGQDLHFLDDCTIQANELKIQCNISNAVIIEGDLIVDNIESSKKIYVESDGELTVGDITKIPWAASVIIKENGTLNLCSNPTLNSADDLGFIIGTVLYNIAAWPGTNPFEEQDINKSNGSESWMWGNLGGNSDWSPKNLIGAYANYDDCMNKKAIPGVLLGYDDDPFLPKDKEIHKLYNCNPCSKDFENTKIEIREIHGKTFRLINGELIYCENDN